MFGLFKKQERVVGVDVGSTAVRLVEIDAPSDRPTVLVAASAPLSGEVFSNNVVSDKARVARVVADLFEKNGVSDTRVATSVPGTSVFTKRITVPAMGEADLRDHVLFEAGNFLPHSVSAVRLDHHVIGNAGKGQVDVLVVAVKNEVIDSLLETFSLAGLSVAVMDVDHFALQNVFELSYPEYVANTMVLVNVGARYSSINICRGGTTLFAGDIALAGRFFTDSLAEGAGVSIDEAERLKKSVDNSSPHKAVRKDVLDANIEYVASEFSRQLTYFWNASGSDDSMDGVVMTGGGSVVPGLAEEISEKTGLEVLRLDCTKGVETGDEVDAEALAGMSPVMSVALGLALRRPGDRESVRRI